QQIQKNPIAFGHMTGKANAAALFAANEDFLLQHQFPNVLEANGTLIARQSQTRRDSGNNQTLRHRADDGSPPALRAIGMKQQQWHNLKRVHKLSGLIDDSQTIGIAVRRQSDVTAGLDDA